MTDDHKRDSADDRDVSLVICAVVTHAGGVWTGGELELPRPHHLLAFLAKRGFVPQAEVATTTSLAWLAERPPLAQALRELVEQAGVLLPERARWISEVIAPDRSRTDLECVGPDDATPYVVVEAKLGAILAASQLNGYATDQRRRLADAGVGRGLLAVLVPEHRRLEAALRLEEGAVTPADSECEGPQLSTVVWTFRKVFAAMARHDPKDADVGQLRAFVEVQEGLDIRPFTDLDIDNWSDRRRGDLIAIADRVSAEITSVGTKLFPSGKDDGFVWRRYVELRPRDTNIAVGVRAPARPGLSPLWARVHRLTPNAPVASARLLNRYSSAEQSHDGHTWVPLVVPVGLSGAEVVEDLVSQARAIAATILGEEWRPDAPRSTDTPKGAPRAMGS